MDSDKIDKIFLGDLDNLPALSTKLVRIFTSSTFTDMLMERNTLMQLFPMWLHHFLTLLWTTFGLFFFCNIANVCRGVHGQFSNCSKTPPYHHPYTATFLSGYEVFLLKCFGTH